MESGRIGALDPDTAVLGTPAMVPAMETKPSLLVRLRDPLDAEAWRAFERVWLEHRSAAETADELSMSIEAVYMAKSRILRRLEAEVEDIAEDFSWLDAIEAP